MPCAESRGARAPATTTVAPIGRGGDYVKLGEVRGKRVVIRIEESR